MFQRMLMALVVVLALVAPVAAQDLPLPTRLKEAKTARVINTGAPQGMFDRLVVELREWKRFELVADKNDAHVTIALDFRSLGNANNWATGRTTGGARLFLTITDNANDEVLLGDMLSGGMTIKSIIRGYLKLDARLKSGSE